MIKVVILDIDDTLCLTEEACFKLENDIAISMGFSPMSREAHQKNWGLPIQKAIGERIPGINVNEFMKRQELIVSDYVKKGILDAIPERNIAALDSLRKAGKKLTILTSRKISEIKHFTEKTHSLYHRVREIYHADNLEYLKPDPRAFNQILLSFSVKPQECVYVGDSIDDALAANGAGIHFIAVLEGGLRKPEDFKDIPVYKFIEKFTDIIPCVLE